MKTVGIQRLKQIWQRGCYGVAIALFSYVSPASAEPIPLTPNPVPELPGIPRVEQQSTFPVGIYVNQRVVIQSTLVRGQEDGSKAIAFEQWLIPYDAVVQALKLQVKSLADGTLEATTAGLTLRIPATKLIQDPVLGTALSIQDLQTLFGLEAEFDLLNYAVQLQVPWLNQISESTDVNNTAVSLEGLPRIRPPYFTLTALEQQTYLSGSEQNAPNYQGSLTAVGQLFGNSWFVRLNQADLSQPQTWSLTEAQLLRQTDTADYIVGSQPTFWPSSGVTSDYVGITTLQRLRFSPPTPLFGGAPDLKQRLQARQLGRTITGRAQPGTLVQLKPGFGDRVVAQQLVDSSGLYRFEGINFDSQFQLGRYRLYLYPQGRLSATPEIRDVSLTPTPGQIPKGAAAWILSAGFDRRFSAESSSPLLGTLTAFRGGLAARWGVSNDVTLGLGLVYEDTLKGLGEIFYQPQGIPLTLAASVLSSEEGWPLTLHSTLQYEPTRTLTLRFNSDEFSQRLALNWQVMPTLTFLSNLDSREPAEVGLQWNLSGKGFFTTLGATIDLENRVRWNLYQQLGKLELLGFGNETGLYTTLSYSFAPQDTLNTANHTLFLGYETSTLGQFGSLVTTGWRYRSAPQTSDGRVRWDLLIGYGFGLQGSGLLASLQTTFIPGLLLRGTYSSASATSGEATFRIEVVSELNLQQGLRRSHRNTDYFRTQGGIVIQPFLDRNQNGKQDPQEEAFTDPNLIILNQKPLKLLSSTLSPSHIVVRLPPSTYRLELDPAGFPPDWQAIADAYAVQVAAGSYTSVKIPLVRAYILSGVVSDRLGKPLRGARVEAIAPNGQRVFSITNDAGVYYLERLQQGTYTLQVNGRGVQPSSVRLNAASEPYQALDLQQP